MSDATFVLVIDGVRQEWSRIDRYLVTRAVKPVPEWIADRPYQGNGGGAFGVWDGNSSIRVNDGLAKGTIYRQIMREGYIARQAVIAEDTSFESRVVKAEYCNSADKQQRQADTAMRRIRDMMRTVRLCPNSLLGDLYDRLVVEHERMRRLAALAIGAHTGALAVGLEAAMTACWQRMENEPETASRLVTRSDPGNLGRTGLSEDDLFYCPECERLAH